MSGTPSHKILYSRTKPSYCRVSNEIKRFDDYDECEGYVKNYGEWTNFPDGERSGRGGSEKKRKRIGEWK
ncbi:hypothetical protein Phum_PHUM193920 [Pediculus humanus corporis]|uniref:Uncharacterized protein n=1 Tax=Pediculus humanus subsp. corporis TaxID=121224 RepID=E0VGV8_PEDHC|nr:uncharacterized protein Phum_PHUM193920 [Pediculus humanus corporis]EEB12614.1 hypothetical protein Phum_PHUM193920 [Pediculus humanus corporis]